MVHLARRLADGETVAVKVILPESAGNEVSIRLFLREASVLSQLEHARIVRFYEVGMARGQFFLAMEYVPAVKLTQLLDGLSTPKRIKTSCAIACQMLDALTYAHARGFVHRDIKPANILVTRTESKLRSKLADFGLAKSFENGGFSGLTMRGEIRGSLPYMPPEQIIDCRLSQPSADIYSMGATLYQLLTGHFPHIFPEGKDPYAVILEEPHVPLPERFAAAPGDLTAVVHKAMNRDPAARFTAADFRAALLPFARGKSE
jgi:serine/threonine-protein kinase